MERSTFRVIVLLLIIKSAVAIILGLSGNHWIQVANLHSGLWKECNDNKNCVDLDRFWLPPVRILLIIGLTFLGFSLLYYMAMVTRPRSFGAMCMSIFLGIASLCVCVGMSVYTYYDMDLMTDSFRYHWGFFMGWIGLLASLIATCLSCHDARRPSSPYEQAIRLQ